MVKMRGLLGKILFEIGWWIGEVGEWVISLSWKIRGE